MKSLAIAHAMKKRAKKMAYGGQVDKKPDPQPSPEPKKKSEFYATLEDFARVGRKMKGDHSDEQATIPKDEMAAGGMVKSAYAEHNAPPYRKSDKQKLAELQAAQMAEGGKVEDDMVSRIMSKRANCYSEGGKVANGGEDELSHMADSAPNNFDDLALRDDLEFSYTGANSGDEISNEQEDHDRQDIVARIMASRRKKDRMPHPA